MPNTPPAISSGGHIRRPAAPCFFPLEVALAALVELAEALPVVVGLTEST